jgi:aspartate-semialdehyde dehydrogenase
MSSHSKPPATHSELARVSNLYRVALVGAATLRGKEVAEVLNDRNFPSLDVKLLDDEESLGQLETMGDEVSFIQSLRPDQFERVDFTFFASDQESTRKNWKVARDGGSAIIDLSASLEGEPGASVRSPWMERQLGRTLTPELQPGPVVTAHPAAVALAVLLTRAQKVGAIRHVIATIFQPASEQGQKGMDELHEQTVNLLSFQQLPKNTYDAQVAFNMVGRYGDRAVSPLLSVQETISRHYKLIAGDGAPVPSILLVQAPIFHGHAFSFHLEMAQRADLDAFSQALAGEHVTVTTSAEDSPSNVNAAGQPNILVSLLPDATQANGIWLWVATDNLRIAASTAVECAETMTATRPLGKIQ